ncbi:MAG: tryptophan synthase subunit alpha [Planctomycetota bacterium]
MNRIDSIFAGLRARGERGLMPFVCGGRPAGAPMAGILRAIEEAGGSIAEIGIPFSDPIADGPVIAEAMHQAIESGVTPGGLFGEVEAARAGLDIGLVAMASFSIAFRLGGPDGFAALAARSGFDGLIIPDCPLEEAGELAVACGEHGLTLSHLVSPTTPPARAEALARASTGFVYLVARAGITGERAGLPDIQGRVAQLRECTDLPIACGFGISTSQQVAETVRHADAAIVGSALVRRLEASTAADAPGVVRQFVGELGSGLRGA